MRTQTLGEAERVPSMTPNLQRRLGWGTFILFWLSLFVFGFLPLTLTEFIVGLVWRWADPAAQRAASHFEIALIVGGVGLTALIAIRLRAPITQTTRHPASRTWMHSGALVSAIVIATLGSVATHSREALVSVGMWAFFFIACWLREADRRLILQLWIGILGLHMMVALVAYALDFQQFETPDFGRRSSGLYGTPNTIYPLSLLAFFLFLELMRTPISQKPISRSWQIAFGAGAVTSLSILILTFSRAGWVGAAAGLGWLGYQARGARRVALITCALSLLAGAAVVRTRGEIVSPDNDGSTAGRMRIWRDAVGQWQKQPWFGAGHGAYRRQSTLDDAPFEPKNLALHIALQDGIFGVALHACFFIALWHMALVVASHAHVAPADRILAGILAPVLPSLMVAGLVDTPVLGFLDRVAPTAALLIFAGLLQGAFVEIAHRCNDVAHSEATGD